eukprot:scaffold45631_cov91-Phaeocystis_antarctica.AAC.2
MRRTGPSSSRMPASCFLKLCSSCLSTPTRIESRSAFSHAARLHFESVVNCGSVVGGVRIGAKPMIMIWSVRKRRWSGSRLLYICRPQYLAPVDMHTVSSQKQLTGSISVPVARHDRAEAPTAAVDPCARRLHAATEGVQRLCCGRICAHHLHQLASIHEQRDVVLPRGAAYVEGLQPQPPLVERVEADAVDVGHAPDGGLRLWPSH